MKDIRPALREFLLDDSDIAAIVLTRVYPIKIPQAVNLASIVYTKISGQGSYHMQGPSGLARPRYQIDAWAPSVDGATTLANLIKDRIDGYSGVMGSGGNAVTVQGAFCVDERESWDEIVKLYNVGRDYFIWNEEL